MFCECMASVVEIVHNVTKIVCGSWRWPWRDACLLRPLRCPCSHTFVLFADVSVLYHSALRFRERLYGALHVDVPRLRLYEPLREMVRQPLLYVRGIVPQPCLQGVLRLFEVRTVPLYPCRCDEARPCDARQSH